MRALHASLLLTHLPYWVAAVALVTGVRRVRRALDALAVELVARAAGEYRRP